ncbi:DUF2934 domain-containing protein [Rhizobiaceae bacterium CRRU44]|uniref:DUF2934 domain-containing protein n=1 Tax=Ferranicluibacter rubi TaxID=2715133 RepID=A0AA43ZKB1_9HYPH|nr:DUF2934 domain-containing protein [Ferranicluibacter rubi]
MNDETDRHAKAHALWEKEGRPEGRHLDHWHAAGISDTNDGDDVQPVAQAETSASEDPAEGSEKIVNRELNLQGKRPKRSAG